jgi:hypothetical protein
MPVVTSVPGINSIKDFSDAIHPSPFRYLDVDCLKHINTLRGLSDTIHVGT